MLLVEQKSAGRDLRKAKTQALKYFRDFKMTNCLATFCSATFRNSSCVAGHPELSELIKRVESTNLHQLMPQSPEGEAKPMKPEDIAVLKRWVSEGAHYRPHWAFDNPLRPEEPALSAAVKNAAKSITPIDSFVLATAKGRLACLP